MDYGHVYCWAAWAWLTVRLMTMRIRMWAVLGCSVLCTHCKHTLSLSHHHQYPSSDRQPSGQPKPSPHQRRHIRFHPIPLSSLCGLLHPPLHPPLHPSIQMPSSHIPAFYRVAFTWFDPLVTLWSAYTVFTDPDTVVDSYAPNVRRDPNLDMFFQQTAGYTLALCFLQTVLLRATDEVRVWKILQWAILIVNVATLYSLHWGLSNQGRLAMGGWRGEDWACLLIALIPMLYRLAFIAEIGFPSGGAEAEKAD